MKTRLPWYLPVLVLVLTRVCATFAAGAEGTLTVKTDPDGIEVWLDDKYIGDSPVMEKKLKAGRYSLKLVDPVQKSSTVEDVFIQPDQATVVEKKIEGKFGSLKVVTEPEGADVSVLTTLGKTPLSNDFMNPGKYRIEIKHPGRSYVPVVQDVVIPKGQTVTVTKTLDKTNPLDQKALIRLGLGAVGVGGFVWAIVAQGDHKHFEALGGDYDKASKSAALQRTLGIVVGSVCIVGLEVVTFF
jgi:hypothetical protein